MDQMRKTTGFTNYQTLVVVLLALAQFTIVLDFMVMAPLGDLLMKSMHLRASQFASAVSAYAFSAGISGLLAAGFADKYDRKKLLLFFYCGFIAGTLVCALAPSYPVLLGGRIVTGIFGGVLGSVSMAIITDLFSFEQRGRVMGFVQMSFAVSQVAGIPIGLVLANRFGWGAPFFLIAAMSILVTLIIIFRLQPIRAHLEKRIDKHPLHHLQHTISRRGYWIPFITTALLSIGGFLIMPFTAPYTINNLGISQQQLSILYAATGVGSFLILPLVGRLSDQWGKFRTFIAGTILAAIMIVVYVHLPPIPLWELIAINTILFAGVMSRMIPSSALLTAIPTVEDRGAFMSINSSLQQIAGGVAAMVAGWLITQDSSGKLHHFDMLGYVSIVVMAMCAALMYIINRAVIGKFKP